MARLNPPESTSVVDVPEALVPRYVAAGWSPVKTSSASRKRSAKTDDEKEQTSGREEG